MKMYFGGVGRFVRDPELKKVGETSVCEFSLAINEVVKGGANGEKKEITSFLDFVVWDKAAEIITKYCKKGDVIHVNGNPRQDKWVDKKTGENRSKVIFRVTDFEFVSSKRKDDDDAGNGTQSDSVPF